MTETGSNGGQLVSIGEVTRVSGVGSVEFFEIHTPNEEEANRYYRNPYDYLERLLEREGRSVNEIHVIRTNTPLEREDPNGDVGNGVRPPQGNARHHGNCVFI